MLIPTTTKWGSVLLLYLVGGWNAVERLGSQIVRWLSQNKKSILYMLLDVGATESIVEL
jgi:hypothetical protein